MASTFERAMRLMRKRDPQLQEDGFDMLRTAPSDFLPDLMSAFETEKDHGLRCWLLELIGMARSEDAYELLARELRSEDEAFRSWAEIGLRNLDSKQARTLLWEEGFSL